MLLSIGMMVVVVVAGMLRNYYCVSEDGMYLPENPHGNVTQASTYASHQC